MSRYRTRYTKAEIAFVWDTLDSIYDDLYFRNTCTFKSRTVDRLGDLDDVFKLIDGEITLAEIEARGQEVQS